MPAPEPKVMRAASVSAKPRALLTKRILVSICALFCLIFVALGVWQVQRLAWKENLIARVDARVHAAPVPAPGPDHWSAVTEQTDGYRHVRVTGSYVQGRDTRVRAVSDLGSGFWIMTPFDSERDFTLLVNRGFLPPGQSAAPPVEGRVTVSGLLRISQPSGGFLRDNNPAQDRWYSRDVAAIANARSLNDVAPYFVDADASKDSTAAGVPIGGLTIISFPNNHLVYAITWFVLALMAAAAAIFLIREGRRVTSVG